MAPQAESPPPPPPRPIFVIKRKKAGHGGHHGGAWKVAYADFVTAFVAALATKREPVWPGDLPRGVRACGLLRRVMRFRLGWTPRFLPVAVVVVMLAFGGLLGIDGADAASLGSGAARS